MNNKGMKQSTKLSLDLISTIIVTLIAGAVTVAAVISMAWFSSNSQTGTTGSTVTVGRERYTVSFLDGSTNGIYYDDIHTIVEDPSAIVWGMTATNNLENGTKWNESARTGDRGVYPGSSGVITFFITPHVENVALEFDLELIGYFWKDITPLDENNTKSFVKISEYGDVYEKTADTLLNGHLLFFKNADEKTETDGTVYYDDFEGPLLPKVSGTKVIRTLTGRVFGDKDEELEVAERVDLYWTWPYSLSKLVDATSCTMISVTETPFIKDYSESKTDYNALVENIRQYPDFYMKGVARPDPYDPDTSKPTEAQIASDYVLYGDYYDQGDNVIGMTVGYVLLKMTIREVEPEIGE